MDIINRRILEKYLRKKFGNKKLRGELEELLTTIEGANWKHPEDMKKSRPDADRVHGDGFYFFNISSARTLILIEIEESQATIVWCGTHAEYELTFRNNKNTIRSWLKTRNWI